MILLQTGETQKEDILNGIWRCLKQKVNRSGPDKSHAKCESGMSHRSRGHTIHVMIHHHQS